MPVLISERAREALAHTRFSPEDLLRAHEDPCGHVLEGTISAERMKTSGADVTLFSLTGDLVVWTVTSSDASKTVVLLSSEVPQNTELFAWA